MSTVAEIEAAIEQLPSEDFRALQQWMDRRRTEKAGRMWTSEELEEGAARMLNEPDPAKADALWAEVVAGFYGEPRA